LSHISNDVLSTLLIEWRSNYEYDIDGIIVTEDQFHSREDGNPSYAFAFKMVLSDQIAEAKVVDVLWNASKDGYLKPRVQIEPIQLGGVTIEYATGFNADFIIKNKIGIGAVVEIIRSGDVIPHIQRVTVQAMEAKMPTVGYQWNESGVDIILENKDSDQIVREKNIVGFFKGIGVDGLSNGNVARIMDAGYNTIPQIIQMKMEDFLKVEGFQLKMATKIYEGIKDKLKSASLITIMSCSNIFGRGFSDKKLELIMENYPDIVFSLESDVIKINKIASIHGMSMKTGEMFVKNIKCFQSFLKEINLGNSHTHINSYNKLESSNKKININNDHILYGKSIVMTGFRDSDVINFIKNVGGKLTTSVSKNTFLIIIKSDGEENNKVQDAIQLNIPILTLHSFKKKYM
jgi:NAD-dependent DNA ligase